MRGCVVFLRRSAFGRSSFPVKATTQRNSKLPLMAPTGCRLVTLSCATEKGFYFEEPRRIADVEADAFQKSVLPVRDYLLQSNDNKFLVIDEDELQCKTLNKEQQHQPDCKFSLQIYKDSCMDVNKRRAVMLYSNINGKNMVVSCNENREICPVQMELPHYIGSSKDKAVFYRTQLSTSRYMLESSLYPSEFLGFEHGEENPSLTKLVLRHKGEDEVDDSCEINFFLM